ncbi:hypothetical protein Tco_1295165 [Tanacetum coccineum]
MDMLDNIREDDMKETISSLTSRHAFLPNTQLLRANNHLRVSKGMVVYDIANKKRHDTTESKDGNAMDMLDNICEDDMKEMVSTLQERDTH